MTRRLWIAAAVSAPLLLIAMARLLPPDSRSWVELALATPVCLWASWPFFVLRDKGPTVDVATAPP
jgi:Cu+-exporting ATPase